MSKVTLHGLPAWVGAIHSPTICEWWNSDPATVKWDRSLLYMVDLAMTPAAADAGRIQVAQIEVDDFTASGGRTTIGPLWPGGTSIGACWVSDLYLARLGGKAVPTTAPGHGYAYEWTAYRYFGELQDRRFYGFHANLVQTQNHLSLVQIWNPGTGAGSAKPAGAWWLDLTAGADPNTPALVPNQPGPLYLDTATVGHIALLDPKNPPFKGGAGFPVAPARASWSHDARS